MEALVELINEAQRETQNNVIKFVEEKFEKRLSEELAKVRVEIAEVKTELIERIENSRSEMKSDIENLRSEMKSDIENLRVNDEKIKTELIERIEALKTNDEKVKSELIRWMFIFWVGQIGAILGILFAFFKG